MLNTEDAAHRLCGADEGQDGQPGSRGKAEQAEVDSEEEAAFDELLKEARRQSGSR